MESLIQHALYPHSKSPASLPILLFRLFRPGRLWSDSNKFGMLTTPLPPLGEQSAQRISSSPHRRGTLLLYVSSVLGL